MNEHDPIIIVGGGQAAMQAVDSLRRDGYSGGLMMIGEEVYAPYQRPPLSKQFLAGETDESRLAFRGEDFYREHGVEMHLGQRVSQLNTTTRRVVTDNGLDFGYSRLLLATGARVRRLNLPGADLPGVHYVRTLDDSKGLRAALGAATKIVVIGGGFIGLEVAAVARKLGKAVTVVETQDRLLARVVAPVVSEYYRDYHRAHGVDIRLSASVAGLRGSDRVTAVELGDGEVLAADIVVAGIGVLPNDELARDAGIACDNGILVDEYAVTSAPEVLAAGDCASHPNAIYGYRLRLESVQNAADQARTAAATMVGRSQPYVAVPWFWSDQYDLKLQMAGLSQRHDAFVVRGDPASRKFAVCYFKDDALIAMDTINRPADHMIARKVLADTAARKRLTPAQAADETFNLKSLLG
ncbi:MAG: FAD-dependent oxidoreductase [Gammaproteobacteria bacterium]|nr:FAD-dependent oxidoreductase [Gammaproteobacteria bacterium]